MCTSVKPDKSILELKSPRPFKPSWRGAEVRALAVGATISVTVGVSLMAIFLADNEENFVRALLFALGAFGIVGLVLVQVRSGRS